METCIKCNEPIDKEFEDWGCEAKGLKIFGITIYKKRFNFTHNACMGIKITKIKKDAKAKQEVTEK